MQNGDWKADRHQHPVFGDVVKAVPANASETTTTKPVVCRIVGAEDAKADVQMHMQLAPKIAQKFADYAKRSRQAGALAVSHDNQNDLTPICQTFLQKY